MTFISYAQNFEDVMIWRALKNLPYGFYIDVGAHDPEIDSVTKAFYDHGWRGINIEPVDQWFCKLEKKRIKDINLKIAAGAKSEVLTIYEIPDTGLSTLDRSIAERHKYEKNYQIISKEIPVRSLTEICKEYHLSPIHFLKIDVEGSEAQVLKGIDFKLIQPWIILIESTIPNTFIENYKEWEESLFAANYKHVYSDGINRYYISSEHLELIEAFKFPPNFFDMVSLSCNHPFCARQKEKINILSSLLKKEKKQAEIKTVEAERFARQLNVVYTSASWRITAPLRWVGDVGINLWNIYRGVKQSHSGSFFSFIENPLRALMGIVLRKPDLAYFINQKILQYPTIHRMLRGYASRHGLMNSFSENIQYENHWKASLQPNEYASLTPRARQIYSYLNSKID